MQLRADAWHQKIKKLSTQTENVKRGGKVIEPSVIGKSHKGCTLGLHLHNAIGWISIAPFIWGYCLSQPCSHPWEDTVSFVESFSFPCRECFEAVLAVARATVRILASLWAALPAAGGVQFLCQHWLTRQPCGVFCELELEIGCHFLYNTASTVISASWDHYYYCTSVLFWSLSL